MADAVVQSCYVCCNHLAFLIWQKKNKTYFYDKVLIEDELVISQQKSSYLFWWLPKGILGDVGNH